MNAYQMPVEEVLRALKTDVKLGLSKSEVASRLKKYGQNVLPAKEVVTVWRVLLHQFVSPLMFILFIAAVASMIIGQFGDAAVISAAVIINVIVGFIQEWKAERAAAALKSYEIQHCTVRRDGKAISIEAKNLVPGDMVLLTAGTKVPADVRLSDAIDFKVEEALLTGESEPVTKMTKFIEETQVVADRTNMAFLGTFALHGKAEGIVVRTGMKTQLGEIAKLVSQTKEDVTPIQVQLKRFSWLVGAIMLGVTGLVFIIGLLRDVPLMELIPISIALAVAAIPEGLLIAVTVILAIGMQRMLKRNALVKKLVAAEALGSVSVICTDKTGTLTQGHLSTVQMVTRNHDVSLEKRIPDEVYDMLVMAALNNDAQIDLEEEWRMGDPSEIALLAAAYHVGVDVIEKRNKFPRIKEIPFAAERKFMATVHPSDEYERIIVKGAPEVVTKMCEMSPEEAEYFSRAAQEMTRKGLRVLALAYKDEQKISLDEEPSGLRMVGLFGMQDALRKEAAQTVAELKEAGIRIVLVTGDHKETAVTIGRGAGILADDQGVMTGIELDEISDQKLQEEISDIHIFARVEPRHKVRIIKAWQANKKFIAMTGDGVNDAPALRAADIGIALGTGTDLAQEVADIVLLDNNLSTIEDAVKEGRTIFDNIRKVIVYLLVDSFSEIVLIGGALLMGLPSPMYAVQILWINLVTDGLPSLALTMEPTESGVMQEKPRPKQQGIVSREMLIMIFIIGIITDIGLFGMYLYLLGAGIAMDHLRTIIFTALAIDSLIYVYSVRTMRTSMFRVNPLANPYMLPAVIGGLIMQLSVVYISSLQRLFYTVSLSTYDWGIIAILALVKVIAIELTKEYFIIRHNNKATNISR